MGLMIYIFLGLVALLLLLIVVFFVRFLWQTRPRQPKEDGYQYVRTGKDDSEREITADERVSREPRFLPRGAQTIGWEMKAGIGMDSKLSFRDEKHTIEIDESPSTLAVSMHPDYLFDGLLSIVSVLFMLPFCIFVKDLTGFLFFGFMLSILLGVVFQSVYTNRLVKCVIKRSFGTIQYERGGFLGTSLLDRNLDFTTSEIEGFEIRNHSHGKWREFRILIVLKSGEKLDLFGKDLGYTQYQTVVEKIRDFINPQLPVKVID